MGKSTLLLQASHHMADAGRRVLLVSGEESPAQIRMRATRLDALSPELFLFCETDLEEVMRAMEEIGPRVVVVDSIQTLFSPSLTSAPGGVSQVRECALRLQVLAKERASPPSWWGTSPRTARSPGRGCSSTWWTPCSTSRASATTPCASCARPRTASAR